MERRDFERACWLNDRIANANSTLTSIRKLEKREDDEEFENLRQIAFDAVDMVKKNYESDFEQL